MRNPEILRGPAFRSDSWLNECHALATTERKSAHYCHENDRDHCLRKTEVLSVFPAIKSRSSRGIARKAIRFAGKLRHQ